MVKRAAVYRVTLLVVSQWLREQGCPWGATVTARAAQANNPALLAWLCDAGCPCDATALDAAAEKGAMQAVEVRSRCLVPSTSSSSTSSCRSNAVAARTPRPHQPLRLHFRCKGRTSRMWAPCVVVCSRSRRRNSSPVAAGLKWLRSRAYPWADDTVARAAYGGHTHIVQVRSLRHVCESAGLPI